MLFHLFAYKEKTVQAIKWIDTSTNIIRVYELQRMQGSTRSQSMFGVVSCTTSLGVPAYAGGVCSALVLVTQEGDTTPH